VVAGGNILLGHGVAPTGTPFVDCLETLVVVCGLGVLHICVSDASQKKVWRSTFATVYLLEHFWNRVPWHTGISEVTY
jgi:hypothetical protein